MTGVLAKWLYQVRPGDPATLAIVVTTILAVAQAAGYLPAKRATRSGPVHTLGGRAESKAVMGC